jgi:hypothetical protein
LSLKKIVGRIYNSKQRHSQDYAIASDLERNIIDIDDSLISSVNKLSCADKASNKCDDYDEQGEDYCSECTDFYRISQVHVALFPREA